MRDGQTLVKVIAGGIAGIALVAAIISESSGSLPTTCASISVNKMNDVYANSYWARKSGLKILDIVSMVDIGSDSKGIRCQTGLVTTQGEMNFLVTTKVVNGTMYIEMQPL